MVFSSFLFIFFFLPACLLCYFLTPARWKNAVLLVFSCFFYAWGAPRFFLLFALSTTVDYFLGRAIDDANRPERRKLLLVCSLVFNLGVLAWFKYANFFVHEANRALAALGWGKAAWVAVALPIGISFFTFHKISYVVDIYRGAVRAARNFVDYALYMALFPQLIAGPIIRYHDISAQIERREHGLEKVFDGMCRFFLGLGKKVLVADVMASTADAVFALGPDRLSTPYAWLGIVCYGYQIYFDFSGYSDMAIGLGRIFGFSFLENFDRPYISRTFTEFWRRWHISLSRWMKDYLYIPLGGNRVSPGRTYLNLWIVFALSGLWHGASWTFVAWGAYHGLFLVLDRLFWSDLSARLGRLANMLLTFVLVLFGWVLFRSADIGQAFAFWRRLVDFPHYWRVPHHVVRGVLISNLGIAVLVLATVICFLPAFGRAALLGERLGERLAWPWRTGLRFAAGLATLLLSMLMLAGSDFSPFIYFRF